MGRPAFSGQLYLLDGSAAGALLAGLNQADRELGADHAESIHVLLVREVGGDQQADAVREGRGVDDQDVR